MDWLIDKVKLNKSAYQNPETAKPSISLSPKIIITALITKRNKPRVIIVTGMVKKTNIGFKKVFNRAKTTATIRAVVISSTTIPGNTFDNTNTRIVEINNLISKFIFYF